MTRKYVEAYLAFIPGLGCRGKGLACNNTNHRCCGALRCIRYKGTKGHCVYRQVQCLKKIPLSLYDILSYLQKPLQRGLSYAMYIGRYWRIYRSLYYCPRMKLSIEEIAISFSWLPFSLLLLVVSRESLAAKFGQEV